MKSKEKSALREKTKKELEALAGKIREEISQLRLDKTQNKLKNTRSIFMKRKELALILTAIKEKSAIKKVKGKTK